MTTPLRVGQKIRAYEFNRALPIFGYATADTSRTSSTTLLNATGVSIDVEANAEYLIDGYLAYVANATADIKVAFSIPSGAGGHWTLYGLGTGTTGSIGDISAYRESWTTSIPAGGSASFSSALVALPRGYLTVGGTAGTLQMQFAQNTSNATATTVKTGTWLRAQRVA